MTDSADSGQGTAPIAVAEAVDRHRQRFKTLLLSTLSAQGGQPGPGLERQCERQPELSYAPYSCDAEGRFYIFISGLARHSHNLQQQQDCCVMFIADERDSPNLFARERLSYHCRAEVVADDDPLYGQQLQQLQHSCGDVVAVLRRLPDFRLFRLQPLSGRYVVGFGKAYDLDPVNGLIVAVGPSA